MTGRPSDSGEGEGRYDTVGIAVPAVVATDRVQDLGPIHPDSGRGGHTRVPAAQIALARPLSLRDKPDVTLPWPEHSCVPPPAAHRTLRAPVAGLRLAVVVETREEVAARVAHAEALLRPGLRNAGERG
ncbi:hypothetical protein AURDEDRAFT_112451 [Auricularia subglabra TFB-10046 SS5]|nr:hypothetical protein AURDEDRAFT_112451 [Auricularia subglabra TFB-10046 SS5]